MSIDLLYLLEIINHGSSLFTDFNKGTQKEFEK
jgi:hypothetical protein